MTQFSRRFVLSTASALCLLFAWTAPADAQEFRIGYVSLDRILRDTNLAKAAQAKFDQDFAKREKDLAELAAAIKAAEDKLQKDLPTLSEAQRGVRQKQLIDMDRDFQRKRREVQEDANARRNEELQQIVERANRIVKQVAEAEKYDVVLQEVVYVNPKHDITDKVVRALNAAK
jgi:outer membrane protein